MRLVCDFLVEDVVEKDISVICCGIIYYVVLSLIFVVIDIIFKWDWM